MELEVVYLQVMVLLSQRPEFQTFWLWVLQQMDRCIKVGDDGVLQELLPGLLVEMEEVVLRFSYRYSRSSFREEGALS